MQVPEEVRHLKPDFSFSGAWGAPLPILCLIFSLWDLKLPVFLPACLCISLAQTWVSPLPLHFSYIHQGPFQFPGSHPAQQSLPFYICNSPAALASAWEWGTKGCQPLCAAMRLPTACLTLGTLRVRHKTPLSCCRRKAAQLVRD